MKTRLFQSKSNQIGPANRRSVSLGWRGEAFLSRVREHAFGGSGVSRAILERRASGVVSDYLRRRNSSRDNPLKPAKASEVGSGTAAIIISPLGEPTGLATPETSVRTAIADASI